MANYITLAGTHNACMAGVHSTVNSAPQTNQAAPQAACHALDTCVNYDKVSRVTWGLNKLII
eukprot:11544441-Ditylum_brightwellii.AAC.1